MLPKNYSRSLLTFFSIENPSLNCVFTKSSLINTHLKTPPIKWRDPVTNI